MAARDRTNGSDSGRVDDNDFVPNSQSEQDDDDVPLALVDEVFDDEEIEDSETEEDIDAYMPKIKFGKARNKKRRQPKRKTNARNKKRCRMGRNKTHASKRGCCDMEEIKRCLDSKKNAAANPAYASWPNARKKQSKRWQSSGINASQVSSMHTMKNVETRGPTPG